MAETQQLFNRELSWLSFNYRVLEEADDKNLPLYERIKFLAIYSSNLDEFYRVRVAFYRSLLGLSSQNKKRLKYKPEKYLKKINETVSKQLEEFADIFDNSILPELKKNGIILYNNTKFDFLHNEFVNNYFAQEILPHIQPVLLEGGDVFSFLQDNVIYLAVKLFRRSKKKKKIKKKHSCYAIVKVPTQYIPRFIELPQIANNHYIVFIEDVIRKNLDLLFPGYFVVSCNSMKLSRDADLFIEDEFQGNLADKIKKSLSKRKTGAPSRFVYDKEMPSDVLDLMKQVFNLSNDDIVASSKYLNFSDLFDFPNPFSPKLESIPMPPLSNMALEQYNSMFDAIKEKDWLLHFPYHSYKYVIRFLNEAAIDPKVQEIFVTQYRVATNSAIVSALISAAHNGKKVTVFVEVQARFDEKTNLDFSNEMKKAGITVLSSIPGIKVHAKVALVIRKVGKDKKPKGYAFLATGNFNEKTAKIYSDFGLFTCYHEIIQELRALFYYLEDKKNKFEFKRLLVGQFNLKSEFINFIDREINNAKEGKKAYMILKMNGLEEQVVINKLYEASLSGVKIDLIVRGICCLIPDKPYSKNITITRIVDRFLEHSRIYMFYNEGKQDIYISSADWMKRNLERRVETAIPIYDDNIKNELLDFLYIQLCDNVKAKIIDSNLNNIPKEADKTPKIRAQIAVYDYYKSINEKLEIKLR